MDVNNEVSPAPPAYRWPWFLAAAVLLGITIAVLSVRSEAQRVKTEQQYQIPKTEPSAP
jgi:F0F1-type ATP synthase assembly protein I